ncbi:MAG TPA: N-acetyltransferase [Nitrospirae bacterium]|nr:N-acetyltransferase [Nitrospirota bacterium]HDK16536.1 N-acetyltransferase [Nitrospirota bacterium]
MPPLLKDIKDQFAPENPFFKHAQIASFIAKSGGKTVGRITAIHNEAHIDFSREKAGFFGFFDCVDEISAALPLIEKARQWLKQKGMVVLRGPMNFSSNEEWGSLIEGFDESPMIMMPYNFPYYKDLFENCGLTKAKDLFAYIIDIPDKLPEKTYRVASIAEKHGVKVRPLNIKAFDEEMATFKSIYNSAWGKNWGFIPMTDEEIDHMAEKLKPIIIPDLTLIAECDGEAAGFMMLLPDFNFALKKLNGRLFPFGIFKALWYSRRIKDLRILLLGVKEKYRRRGVDAFMFIEGLKTIKKLGYKRAEFSWILEDNYPVQKIIGMAGGRLYKKYRIYEIEI